MQQNERQLPYSPRWSEASLRRVGVEIRDNSSGILGCTECGGTWVVNYPGRDRHRAPGWWRCPQGCNEPE